MYPQHSVSGSQSQALAERLFKSPEGLDSLLEQLHKGDCPHPHLPFLMATNASKKRLVFFTPRCKLWSCLVCGPTNVKLAAWRASDGAKTVFEGGNGISFVTLTSHEALAAGQSWWVLPKAWKKLHVRMQRAAGRHVEYYAVPELHENGRVHLHMLTNAGLRKKWWKDNARACGFGYQNDAQEVVAVGGVAAYVTKYLSKTLQFSNMPPGTRRIRTSQGWPKLPELPEPEGWVFKSVDKKVELGDLVAGHQAHGYSVVFAGSKSAWEYVAAE